MSQPRDWFFRWFERHKARNPHHAWRSFEADQGPLLSLGWIKSLDELGATEADADAVSERMQRSGEAWPVDHLARLLAILGPMVASRKADADMARRRRESAEWDRLQDERLEARERFRQLPAEEGYSRLARVRARYPSLADLPGTLEWFAVDEWRGGALPEPDGPLGPSSSVDDPDSPEPADGAFAELTPAQMAFLASLTPGQLRRFDAASAARRREILAPFADDFDRRLFDVMAVELRPAAMEFLPEPATTG